MCHILELLSGIKYKSAFIINRIDTAYAINSVTTGSGKATTISKDNVYITTLDILSDVSSFIFYLKGIGLYKEEQEPYPEWLESYQILDDKIDVGELLSPMGSPIPRIFLISLQTILPGNQGSPSSGYLFLI